MQFTIRNAAANKDWMSRRILLDAGAIIKAHNITPGEAKLNRYLLKTYGVNLKVACLYLLSRSKFYKDLDNTITVLFLNKEDDKLAALITYGDGLMKGSNLLKEAFFRI